MITTKSDSRLLLDIKTAFKFDPGPRRDAAAKDLGENKMALISYDHLSGVILSNFLWNIQRGTISFTMPIIAHDEVIEKKEAISNLLLNEIKIVTNKAVLEIGFFKRFTVTQHLMDKDFYLFELDYKSCYQ